MGRLSKLFDELSIPDDFKGKPVRYAGNQCGHIWIGFNAVTAMTCLMWWITGQYPNQIAMVGLIVGIYFIWWELIRWNGIDSIEDTLFLFFGSAVYIFIDMEFVMGRLGGCLIVINLFLALGIWMRAADD